MPNEVTVSSSDFNNWSTKTTQEKQAIKNNLLTLIQQYQDASGQDICGERPDRGGVVADP